MPEVNITEDLDKAIRYAAVQYKPQEIHEVSEFRFDNNSLWSFVPKPQADESWATGGSICIYDKQSGEAKHTGEIAAYEHDEGRIHFDAAKWEMTSNSLTQFRFQYIPFDYSSVVIGAFSKLNNNHPELLKKALAGACGLFDENFSSGIPSKQASRSSNIVGIDRIWQLPWSFIWGPPGTGKTQTVAQALFIHISTINSGKILVVTPTNNAADEVALRLCTLLADHGRMPRDGHWPVYRGGRGADKRLSDKFPQCVRSKEYAAQYDPIRKEISALEETMRVEVGNGNYSEVARLSKEIEKKRNSLPDETQFVIKSGKSAVTVVILTTYKASTFAGDGDDPVLFDKVIIDEAGMVSRAVCSIISTLGKTTMLSGDPKQIGPILASPPGLSKNVRKWLLMSGLSHLESAKASLADQKVLFLNSQYRMHPDISKVVSEFTYDGILRDSDTANQLSKEAPLAKDLPSKRAAFWTIDEVVSCPADACPSRAGSGRGWTRKSSATVAINAANAATLKAKDVIILTPYRAQVNKISKLLKPSRYKDKLGDKVSVGTIHKRQGAEADVVIVDLVNGASSWIEADISMLLNVAISRARKHFILIVSRAELNGPVLRRLAKYMSREDIPLSMSNGLNKQCTFSFMPENRVVRSGEQDRQSEMVKTLGDEIHFMRQRMPLYSERQMKILDRNIGGGHWLVRGVAGSGKTLILANWAVRSLMRNPQSKLLVTYFNKGMQNMIKAVLDETCQRLGANPQLIEKNIDVRHVDKINREDNDDDLFDAVFVDEAQDMELEQVKKLYNLCTEQKTSDLGTLRNLILFYDDSQNIYGRKTLEDLKNELPGKIAFHGRSIVLREAYRSTQSILGFAINMALDPKRIAFEEKPGLLEYYRISELANEGLIVRPEDALDGMYHVRYTDCVGTPPIVFEADNSGDVFNEIALEIKRLIEDENVSLGDILVITVSQPAIAAQSIERNGIAAKAYARNNATDPIEMPARNINHVRCTTFLSCKGHEAPIVFFANVQDIDEIIPKLGIAKNKTPEEVKKMQRCSLYVVISRAMIRLYVCGTKSEILDAAREYATAEIAPPGLL